MSTHKFVLDFSVHPHISLGFQCRPTNFYRISVSTHKFHYDFSVHPQISIGFQCPPTNFIRMSVFLVECSVSYCCRRQKGKPASCAGCELCGREPALPAFSTDAHHLQCVCAVSCLTLRLRNNMHCVAVDERIRMKIL